MMKVNENIVTPQEQNQGASRGQLLWLGCFAIISAIISLLVTGRHNYLLFHSLVELGAVAVAWSVFFLVWNARRLKTPPAFVMLGIGYMIVGVLDLLHTLAYEGMGVFPEAGTDLATQLWISARFIETAALILFPMCFNRGGLCRWGVRALAAAAFIMLGSIFVWDFFPECFTPETGLTPFKIASEYTVMGLLAVSVVLTCRKKNLIGQPVALFLSGAMLVTIVSEFCFTLYASPFGTANMIGHLFKVISFMLIYRALIVESLERPMETLAQGLRKSEEKYRNIVRALPDLLFRINAELKFTDVQTSVPDMLLAPADEIIGKTVWDILPPDIAGLTEKKVMATLESGKMQVYHYSMEMQGVIKEGETRMVPCGNGEVLAIVRDITEQRQMASDLAAEHAKLEAIFNASPDILVLKDNNSVYQRVNPAFRLFIGKDDHDITGRSDYDLFPKEEARQYMAGDASVVQTGVREDQEWQVSGQMGKRWLQVIKTPVCNAGGQSLGVLCTGRDVTEHRRLKNLLLNTSRKEQEKLARELHDGLCQDLKGLEIQAALLEDGIVDKDKELKNLASDLSEGINLAVRRAYGIMQGMFPADLGTRGFSEALQDLAEKITFQRETQVLLSVQDDLSPQNHSQAHQLYRIAQEAINNALQHSEATKIELIWREKKGRKLLVVRDNGIGIGSRHHKTPGGLGLLVMSSRAQSINAGLTVKDVENGGTEVEVRVKNE
ncbi:MAG: MASE3 domain-containing protein [Desulfobacteraceae bacterium]